MDINQSGGSTEKQAGQTERSPQTPNFNRKEEQEKKAKKYGETKWDGDSDETPSRADDDLSEDEGEADTH